MTRLQTANQSKTPVTFQIDPDTQTVTLGGMTVTSMVEQFGTPLYVMDVATIESMIQTYHSAFSGYDGDFLVLYAAKANFSKGLCQLASRTGLGVDVVSGGELYTAKAAGFPMERVLFNGNNKTLDELCLALDLNVGLISVDNRYELEQLFELAKTYQTKAGILLRVTPGIECHTHDYIKTGHQDSKFGFPLSEVGEVIETIQQRYADHIDLKGLHAHIGSQIFELTSYQDLVEVMLNAYRDFQNRYQIKLTHLNLGGGLGVAYGDQDDPPHVQDYANIILQQIDRTCRTYQLEHPTLLLEPGRSLVATAGVTVYRVGSMKTIPELNKTYVAIDGGMGDNIRPALYGARYSALIANKAHEPHVKPVTIAGKYCESGDIILPEFMAPASLAPGDLLLVFATGAYNASMASNYNRMPRPATVVVKEGKAHVLVKRETYQDLVQYDQDWPAV